MPLALIAVGSGVASAGSGFSGNAPGTVSCSGVSGSVSFKPPLTLTGGGTSVKAKGVISGCHASNPSVSITDGKFKAAITSSGSGCAGLAGGTTSETFTIKWKGDFGGSKAKFTSTTVVVKGSTIVTNGAGDEGFELPNPSNEPNGATATGSFGTVSSSESFAYTNETAGQFSSACGTGIKKVTLASGQLNSL
ncbi:MAG TPA: hypothetical protein VK215_16385 [Acidimicrobiales bacterium]|nr:hypothetical protein [Acidimicrobiales bacterium]